MEERKRVAGDDEIGPDQDVGQQGGLQPWKVSGAQLVAEENAQDGEVRQGEKDLHFPEFMTGLRLFARST
ncbi:MAG: hypothetical protein WDO13_00860 [Verrucomicrobiota bacterium]